MPFSRTTTRDEAPAQAELTARMVGVGMVFAAEPDEDADIEGTVVGASVAGMIGGDLRVLAVLTTWLGVHHARLNADRLARLVDAHTEPRVRAYWAAVATWLGKDRRFARLIAGYDGPPVELLAVGNEFQLRRRGEDQRFHDTVLRAPAGTLRDRREDVLAPEVLVQRHRGYRNRVLIGPTWRADVWTVLEKAPDLTVADVARRAGCSFATAWQVTQDFRLFRAARRRTREPDV